MEHCSIRTRILILVNSTLEHELKIRDLGHLVTAEVMLCISEHLVYTGRDRLLILMKT